MEGLLLRNHETPPKTYSELFSEMSRRMDGFSEKQDAICDRFCKLEDKLQPILEAQEGVSTIGKLYKYIPMWVKIWAVGLISWMLGNKLNF